jgi:hypothetical protein
MDTRGPSWQKIPVSITLFDFKWTPYSQCIKFEFLGKHGEKNLVNHFEHHHCITQKDQVYFSMQKAAESMYKDAFDVLPITFVIDNQDRTKVDTEFNRFQLYFNTIEKHKHAGLPAVNQALSSHPNL